MSVTATVLAQGAGGGEGMLLGLAMVGGGIALAGGASARRSVTAWQAPR